MCDLMYASSPSWYCSKAVDADQRGFLYFSANYNLYVLNLLSTPPKYVLHLQAHQQRAVGVSVCNSEEVWSCCTIGEDGKVKIWNLESKTCLEEHSTHKNPLTCVHWSPKDRNLIATSDSKGSIVVWRISTSEFSCFTPEVSHVFALTFSPHQKELLAIGYKSSSILIINVERSGQIVQKFRGHDEEIHGLCWCPKQGEDLQWRTQGDSSKEDTKGCLLASSSKDRTIRVWATSSGRSLLTMKLPPISGVRKDKVEDRVGGRVWVGLHWPPNRPTQLVSSSFNGDMLLWDLCKTGKQKHQILSASKHARGHARLVFNVVTAGPDFNILCTSSMDRNIILWDMTTLKTKLNIPTLGGFGYCLATSPVNPGRLAVGSGDCLIRIWNIDNPLNPFDTQVYWQGLKSKVTALCWHPVKEGQLAYGTEDGRVGIYEVFSSSKSPQISSTYHRGTVYNVAWGPPCIDHENFPKNNYFLYSCGDGRLLQHEPYHLDREALEMNKHIRQINEIKGKYPSHTEISFKPDYKVVAIGNDDGSIDILSVPDLKKVCFIQVHRKLINVIKWHPEYTADSRDVSPYNFWLASGSGEPDIHVVDLTNVIEGSCGSNPVVITESRCQLSGHSNRITQLSWSTFTQGMLVSASYDHTVQVWDVKSCKPVANYRGHYGRVMCVQWSELDPDIVYSGGQDNTVQCWNISKQQFSTPPVGNTDKNKKNKKKKRNGAVSNLTQSNVSSFEQKTVQEMQHLLELKKKELLASVESDNSNSREMASAEILLNSSSASNVLVYEDVTSEEIQENTEEEVSKMKQTVTDVLGQDLVVEQLEEESSETSSADAALIKKDLKEKKKKKYRSLLPKSSLKDNRGKTFQHEDCVELAKYIYQEKSGVLGEELFHIGHFINRRTTLELIRFEGESHKLQNNYDQVAMLEIIKGNIGGMLRQSAIEGRLNDWLLGLAPMGSSPFWKDLCLEYSKQLEKDGHVHKAMSYLLACNKIYEAIDVLVKNGAYKDAVCLARLRLSPYDPKLLKIYTQWADVLAKDSNLEMAAKCYLASGEPLEASKCLARRTDLTALKAAAEICVIADHMEQAKLYTHRLIQDCYIVYDWNCAQEIIRYNNCFHHYALPVSCHEVLVNEFTKMKVLASDITSTANPSDSTNTTSLTNKLPSFLVNAEDEDILCPWPLWLVEGEIFSLALVRIWVEKWGIVLETQQLTNLYTTLKNMKTEKHGLMQLSQILVSVTFDIVLGILQLLLGDGDIAAEHWVLAISTCVDQNEIDMAQSLCRLLLPQGVGSFLKLAKQIHALKITTLTATPVRKTSLTNYSPKKLARTLPESHLLFTCNKETCTPLDCLTAYYCVCVLKHWLSAIEGTNTGKKSGRKSSSLESPDRKSVQSNSPRSPVTPKKGGSSKSNIIGKNLSNEFTHGSSIDESNGSRLMSVLSLPSRCLSLSETALCQVSQNILWNIQAKKQKLEESLSYIKQAISDMICKHKDNRTVHSSSTDLDDILSPIGSLNEITTPTKAPIKRAASGEYIAMNKNEKDGKLFSTKRKPHEEIPITPPAKAAPMLSMIKAEVTNDEDEFVDMKEEITECTNQCEGSTDKLTDNQTDQEKSLTIDISEDTQTAVFSLGSPISSGKSEDIPVTDEFHKLTTNNDVTIEALATETLAYANIPDDWFEMLVDTKYKCDYVTLQLLTTEQETIQQQLQELSKTTKNIVFPPVLSCARDIAHILTEQTDAEWNTESFGQSLLEWINKHKYLTQHEETVNKLKLMARKTTV